MSKQFRFHKEERLCSKVLLDEVFKNGEALFSFPFRILFYETKQTQKYPAQVVFSVPKRNFKHAVTRNKIRRRIREAYRLNKHSLYKSLSDKKKQLAIAVIYTDKVIQNYTHIEKGIIKGLEKINSRLT